MIGVAERYTITALQDGKQQVKIRLYGTDTPERRQAFGAKAKQSTSEMVLGKEIEVEPIDTGRDGNTVALVEELVNVGFA